MNLLIFQLLNGLGLGMIYFLLAVGLNMVFGLMRFVNFMHGALYMVAAYSAFLVNVMTGNVLLALLVGPAMAALIAVTAERFLLRHTYAMPHESQILITFGVALLIQESIVLFFGSLAKPVPVPEMFAGAVMVGNFFYPTYRLVVVGVAIAVALVMWIIIDRTRFGAVLRAGAESAEMVGLLGVDLKKMFMIAFAIAGALAGLAGVLIAPLRGADPFMAFEALSIAFVVVVLGGIGSYAGALVGGLLIGIIQSVMSGIWPEGAQLMIFAAMATVLLFRPAGLMGRA